MNDFEPIDPDFAARVRAGRTLTVCQVEVFAAKDGAETLCAVLQQTVIRLAKRPDIPEG